MKANEFVKKFGITEAKKVLHCMDDATEFTTHMLGDTWDKPTLIDAVGLRRLIESHELVESHGGLYQARKVAHKNCFEYPVRLLQAIADVESCQ